MSLPRLRNARAGLPLAAVARHEDETKLPAVPNEQIVTDLGPAHKTNAYTSTFDETRTTESQVQRLVDLPWPKRARPMAAAWDEAITYWRNRGLGSSGLADLRWHAKNDIKDAIEHLDGASKPVITTWQNWYGRWAQAEADLILRSRLKRILARRDEQQAARIGHNDRTDRRRLRDLAERLVASMRAAGGSLPHDPVIIGKAMSVRRPVTPERVAQVVAELSARYVVKVLGARLILLQMTPDLSLIDRIRQADCAE